MQFGRLGYPSASPQSVLTSYNPLEFRLYGIIIVSPAQRLVPLGIQHRVVMMVKTKLQIHVKDL
jgi:hypothetical protein